jgi:hypothetical protein
VCFIDPIVDALRLVFLLPHAVLNDVLEDVNLPFIDGSGTLHELERIPRVFDDIYHQLLVSATETGEKHYRYDLPSKLTCTVQGTNDKGILLSACKGISYDDTNMDETSVKGWTLGKGRISVGAGLAFNQDKSAQNIESMFTFMAHGPLVQYFMPFTAEGRTAILLRNSIDSKGDVKFSEDDFSNDDYSHGHLLVIIGGNTTIVSRFKTRNHDKDTFVQATIKTLSE